MSRSAIALIRSSVAALAVMALYASMATSASAWLVAGSELTSTAALASTASVDEHFKLKTAGVTIECAGSLNAVGGEITAADGLNISKLTFSECSGSGSCTVAKSIATVPVETQFIEHTLQEDPALILPKTKTTLATISYEGETCALAGVQPVSGQILVNFPKGQESRTLQEVKASTTEASAELKVGSSAAEFKGTALLKLQAGQAMAARLATVIPSITRWNAEKEKINMAKKLEFEYTNTGPGNWTPGATSWHLNTLPAGEMNRIFFIATKNEAGWCRPNVAVALNAKCKEVIEFEPKVIGRFYRGVTGDNPGADGINAEGEGE